MRKRRSSSKTVHLLCLLALIALTASILGCEKKAAPPQASAAASASATPATANKQQAVAALMSLPELKAWSSQIEKASDGKLHGALVEYDPQPKLVNGKRYWQWSFVENGSDASRGWESFLVDDSGADILVDDPATDQQLTLEQWRKQKRPMERTAAE